MRLQQERARGANALKMGVCESGVELEDQQGCLVWVSECVPVHVHELGFLAQQGLDESGEAQSCTSA